MLLQDAQVSAHCLQLWTGILQQSAWHHAAVAFDFDMRWTECCLLCALPAGHGTSCTSGSTTACAGCNLCLFALASHPASPEMHIPSQSW